MAKKVMCPTPCDDDCEAQCHEVHQPYLHRDHEPQDCPAWNPFADHIGSSSEGPDSTTQGQL